MRRAAGPMLVCVVVAAALYLTRGVLDETVLDGVRVRVAFLPPWESAAALLAAAALGVALLVRLTGTRPSAAAPSLHVIWPALASGALVLPYLPVLPDRLPVLQILAGPVAWLVWLVAVALSGWAWSQARPRPVPAWLASRRNQSVAVAVATLLAAGVMASRLTGTILYPAGDEPHYLVIAQSLWRDGDFRIENNHQRRDYAEYFTGTLDPHYLTRGADGEIYSIHPVGLPIVLTPVYAAGGYRLVVLSLLLMAAVAAALSWRWTAAIVGSASAATFGWAVVALSTPFLFNTFTVYPEIAAALAVMVGLTTRRPWLLGLMCGALPWLSTKYAPMSAALLAAGMVAGRGAAPWRLLPIRAIAQAVLPYGAMLLAWFAFFYAIWGTPRPQAPYGAMVQTTPWNLIFGAPGLLFDQEYGLLPYAPAYVLAATGLWAMWRSGGEQRVQAARVALVFAALIGTVGAFRIWWGGSASPSRPLASGLLPLALPVAAAFAAAPAGSARRAAQHLLLWLGAGVAIQMGLAQQGFLLANGRDGTSALLEWWLPRWQTWSLVPSFIYHEAATALGHTAVWLAAAAGAAVVLRRLERRSAGAAALAACGVLSVALIAVALIVPLLPDDPEQPAVDLRARGRIAALDSFDHRARTAAVVYDPLRKAAAIDLVSQFTFTLAPGLRPEPQPLRVIHNGRYSLPAGRYRADVLFLESERPGPQRLALQFGRTGPPVQTWTIDPAGGRWSTEFTLPVDMSFVGFRGDRAIERAISLITITPLSVVDVSLRPALPTVLAAAGYGNVHVFFHDDSTTPEEPGFWVLGQRPTQVTVAGGAGHAGPLTMNLRADRVANHVTLRAPGWTRGVDLSPGVAQTVELPAASRGVVSLTITSATGFVPADVDPSSKDRRLLGVWVDFQ